MSEVREESVERAGVEVYMDEEEGNVPLLGETSMSMSIASPDGVEVAVWTPDRAFLEGGLLEPSATMRMSSSSDCSYSSS